MSDKYQGVECYQCGRLSNALSYRSRCLKCETERADGNAAENDMLRKRLAAAEADAGRMRGALEALISVAERCDGWESFPSDALDAAIDAARGVSDES